MLLCGMCVLMFVNKSASTVLRRSVVFSGRASLREFLGASGLLFAGMTVASALSRWLAKDFQPDQVKLRPDAPILIWGFVSCILYSAVGSRRLHDQGWRGFWACVVLVPFVLVTTFICSLIAFPGFGTGVALLTVLPIYPLFLVGLTLMFTHRSQPGPNRYGPNPHEVPQ